MVETIDADERWIFTILANLGLVIPNWVGLV